MAGHVVEDLLIGFQGRGVGRQFRSPCNGILGIADRAGEWVIKDQHHVTQFGLRIELTPGLGFTADQVAQLIDRQHGITVGRMEDESHCIMGNGRHFRFKTAILEALQLFPRQFPGDHDELYRIA